jgi:hypothetical protein
MPRILLICQTQGCDREFRDVNEYFEHQNCHEEEKKVKEN